MKLNWMTCAIFFCHLMEGEKRVIALARATGVGFVLTDDEKQDGPYWSIERGIISHVEALAFWDLVYWFI